MRIFTAENFAIADLAAREQGRYAISGVHVTPKSTVATDGRAVVIVDTLEVPDGDEKNPFSKFIMEHADNRVEEFEPFIFPRDQAKKVSTEVNAGLKSFKGRPSAWVTGEKRPALNYVNVDAHIRRSGKVEGIFPKVEHVLHGFTPGVTFEYSPNLLLSVFRLMANYCDHVKVGFCTTGGMRLDATSRNGQKWQAALMNASSDGTETKMLEMQAVDFLKSKGYSVEKKG